MSGNPEDDDWPWSQVLCDGFVAGLAGGMVRTHDYALVVGLVVLVAMQRSSRILHALKRVAP